MIDLRRGDCLEVMRTLADASVDAVVTDPPYPEIDRPYGRMTEAEWHAMMRALIPEVRRVLKPRGSAVFVLQPNYKTAGQMRLWLWEFVVWAGRQWNLVQDAYWWNYTSLPTQGCQRGIGLMRSSVKHAVWLGPADCYRSQESVLMLESDRTKDAKTREWSRIDLRPRKSGKSDSHARMYAAADERGGTTPFNLIPVSHRATPNGIKHPGATPEPVCDWWVRYISPPGGVVLDPFIGSGTVGLAALNRGRSIVGIERDPGYFAIARRRIKAARATTGAA